MIWDKLYQSSSDQLILVSEIDGFWKKLHLGAIFGGPKLMIRDDLGGRKLMNKLYQSSSDQLRFDEPKIDEPR